MRKIKAYTLMEVTVAMLLSAITIAICYTAYTTIKGYFFSFKQRTNEAEELLYFKHVMERDLQKSNYVFYIKDGIELLVDSSSVKYIFNDSSTLRSLSTGQTTTLKVAAKDLKFFFEQKEIVGPDTIDQLNLNLKLGKTNMPLQFHKFYSASNLFK